MLKDSVFRAPIYRNVTKTQYDGDNYKGKILKRTMSPAMFNSNKTVYTFLIKLDNMIYEMFEDVKQIKLFRSLGRDKYDTRFDGGF